MNNANLQKWLPGAICILVLIVIGVALYCRDFSKHIDPKLKDIETRINAVEKQNIDSLINVINGMYLLSRGNSAIKVGINNNLKDGDATIFKNENLEFLEVDARFYLTNPRSPLKPHIEIKIIEERSKEQSDADLFIGIEAAEMLGIKGDMLNIGVFSMGIRRIDNGY